MSKNVTRNVIAISILKLLLIYLKHFLILIYISNWTNCNIRYLVQLKENTGSGLVIVISVLFGARMPVFHIDIADFSGWRWLIVIALVNISAETKNRSRCYIIWNMWQEILRRNASNFLIWKLEKLFRYAAIYREIQNKREFFFFFLKINIRYWVIDFSLYCNGYLWEILAVNQPSVWSFRCRCLCTRSECFPRSLSVALAWILILRSVIFTFRLTARNIFDVLKNIRVTYILHVYIS